MQLNDVLRRLRTSGLLFIAVLVFGSLGYFLLGKDATFLDAFYMTAITITTIGFHEIIDLSHNPGGRFFTIFIAFSGIGIITYFFSNLAALFIEGDIQRTFFVRRMENKVSKLIGHYVICGGGRVGKNIALELHGSQRKFVIADLKLEQLQDFTKEIEDLSYLQGDCTDDEFLEKLGIKHASGVFVCANDDNTNLVICLSARQLNPAVRIIALSKEIQHVKKLRKAGANKVITPTFTGGKQMASEMIRPHVTSFLEEMSKFQINQRLEELPLPKALEGKHLEDLGIAEMKETIVLAVKENDSWTYKPKGGHVIKENSHLILMTTPQERVVLEENIFGLN